MKSHCHSQSASKHLRQVESGSDLLELVREEASYEIGAAPDNMAEAEADAPNDVPVEAVEPPIVQQPYAEMLDSLGISQVDSIGARTDFVRANGNPNGPIGFIHRIGNSGVNLKATCKIHDKCVCWVQPRVHCSDDDVWRALVKWLASATAQTPQSLSDHFQASVDVKRMFGMKPRNKA